MGVSNNTLHITFTLHYTTYIVMVRPTDTVPVTQFGLGRIYPTQHFFGQSSVKLLGMPVPDIPCCTSAFRQLLTGAFKVHPSFKTCLQRSSPVNLKYFEQNASKYKGNPTEPSI